MNHIYRLIWNYKTQSLTAVAENATGQGKNGGRAKTLATAVAGAMLALGSAQVFAADVCAGSGTTTINTTQTLNDDCVLDAGGSLVVQSGGVIATPLYGVLANGVTSSGGIQNTGGTIAGVDSGIRLTAGVVVSNGITNAGVVSSNSSNNSIGFALQHAAIDIRNNTAIGSTITGGVHNLAGGTITGSNSGTAAKASGVYVLSSFVEDGISNAGEIFGSGPGIYIEKDQTNLGSAPRATISGGILNTTGGAITSTSKQGVYAHDSSISGGITNQSGATISGATGIAVSSSQVTGGITNAGMISANNNGTAGLGFWNSTIGGAIYNSGVISIGNARTYASGILLSNTQIANGITNAASGTISSSKYGIYISSASTVSGITNEGTISGVTAFRSVSQTVLPTIQNQPGALISGKLSLLSATTLANSGIVSLPTATSSTMAGSYTQSSTGIFRTGVSSASSLGKLTVGGTVTLPSNANFDVVTGDAANCSGITLGGTIAGVITATGSLVWDDTSIVNDDCTNLHFEARRNSGNTKVIDLVAVVPPSTWSVTSGTGVNGTVSCTTPVLNNGTATCTATPDPGYQLSGASGAAWCGTVSTSGNSITASPVTNTCIINGTFAAIPYTIAATASPSAGGTVTCSPNPVNSGGSSTCTPTAATGYTFSSFSGDCSGSTCTLTNVTANKSVSANFAVNAVAGQCGPANGVAGLTSPLAQNLCTTGTASNVTAAAGGYSWSCAGVGSGTPAACTAPGVTAPGSTVTTTTELVSGAGCRFSSVTPLAPPAGGPGGGVTMPYGVVDFTLVECTAAQATVRMTYSGPVGNMGLWKYGPYPTPTSPVKWYQMTGATVSGNSITFTIVDNGPGDADPAVGVIADPAGPGTTVNAPASIPTLSEWGVILMSGLLGLFGLAQVRRRR